jgi:hypothetical protein
LTRSRVAGATMTDPFLPADTEENLVMRLKRHGWVLERQDGEDGPVYRLVDDRTGEPVVSERFDMSLRDVAIWLE